MYLIPFPPPLSGPLSRPLLGTLSAQWIDSNPLLQAACESLMQEAHVAVDTEFIRETSFWPKLCLIQLCSETQAFIVDTLAAGLDLTPFFTLMRHPETLKIFHAGRQDLEIIWHLSHALPTPVFDTQIAAMVCGYGEQPSYSDLAQSICKISLDKSSRFTDWAKRPLSEAQISYALADVTYLRDIYTSLRQKLDHSQRFPWLNEEMHILTSPSTYEQHPDQAWERFRGRLRKPRDMAMVMELAAWRETLAQQRNLPRGHILKDEILLEISGAAPKTLKALSQLRCLPSSLEHSPQLKEIFAALERGHLRDVATLPPLDNDRRAAKLSPVIDLLKVLLRHVSESYGVASKIIASVADLEAIALQTSSPEHAKEQPTLPALKGWRYDIFGKYALQLKEGKLALKIEGQKTALIDL